jgi:Arc/MetJ-type ribon-helix-helix transcriptional regulator
MKEKTILNFVATKEFIEKIDDYRFEHRFETRAEAIRHLIERGLEAEVDRKDIS